MEGSLQSLSWGSRAVGSIASAYFSGSLVQLHGPRFVFGLTAFLPLILSLVALIIEEKKMNAAVLRGRKKIKVNFVHKIEFSVSK